jgi:hypothetical protein
MVARVHQSLACDESRAFTARVLRDKQSETSGESRHVILDRDPGDETTVTR